MKVADVHEVVNSITKQMTGLESVQVYDATSLSSLGKEILSSDILKDMFYKKLFDRIGRTIISNRKYKARGRELIFDTFEYGAILQKIYVAPMEAEENPSWFDLEEGEKTQIVLKKPDVSQRLFENRDTFQITTSIPDIQIKSAFSSEQQMAAFIDSIMIQLENSMELNLEALTNNVYSTVIAQRLINANGTPNSTVVDLYTSYKNVTGKEPANALTDPDFYRYCATVISHYVDMMQSMSVSFNTEGYYRHTPMEYLRVTMLSLFIRAFDTYLQSGVFHNELTKLPNYTEVNYWQGAGRQLTGSYNFGYFPDTSRVVLTLDGQTVSQEGVVCIISDIESAGVMVDNLRVRSVYDNLHEFTAIYSKADRGYFVDPSENSVIFTISPLQPITQRYKYGYNLQR